MSYLNSLLLCGGLAMASLTACAADSEGQPGEPDKAARPDLSRAAIPVSRQTEAPAHEANAAALWASPADPGASRIYGTGGTGGLEVYSLDGRRVARVQTGGELKGLDILPSFRAGGASGPLLVGLDVNTPAVVAFAVDPATGNPQAREIRGIELSGAYEGICAYQSKLDGEAYIFLTTGSGRIEQWWLQDDDGVIRARLARSLNVASEGNFCTADPAGHALYVAEKEVGIWKFNADVETEVIPEIIDVVKFGDISKEVGGLAVYRDAAGTALLVASNASDNSLHFYDINSDHQLLAAATLEGHGDVGAVEEAGGLAVSAADLGGAFAAGVLVAMDDDNGTAPTNYKLLPWSDVDSALGLDRLARKDTAPAAASTFATVPAALATAPVATPGDAADDPAIWVHPGDPSRSTLIGTNKQGGLYVYNLDGAIIQYLQDGQMNNVDLRYNVALGGERVDLVTASNRSDASIAIYKVDPATGKLVDVADGTRPTELPEPYGSCMYQHPETRRTYVFVNDKSGLYRQWELKDSGDGKVSTELVREFSVPSQPEGCAADDEYGVLFAGEEDEALWKFSAAPDGGSEGEVIATIADNPAVKDDFEGVTLYYGEDGDGYVLVSSQGNDSYAVYERRGEHKYLGSFAIVANGELGIDGASETDGIDVISTPLGEQFPYGLFIAQDGRNLMPAEAQNYKAVSWEAIADALGLEKYSGWNPREATLRD